MVTREVAIGGEMMQLSANEALLITVTIAAAKTLVQPEIERQ